MRVGLQHETEQGQLLLTFATRLTIMTWLPLSFWYLDFVTTAVDELTVETARDWLQRSSWAY